MLVFENYREALRVRGFCTPAKAGLGARDKIGEGCKEEWIHGPGDGQDRVLLKFLVSRARKHGCKGKR